MSFPEFWRHPFLNTVLLTHALVQVDRVHRGPLLALFSNRSGSAICCFSVRLRMVVQGAWMGDRCLEVRVGSAELLEDIGECLRRGQRGEGCWKPSNEHRFAGGHQPGFLESAPPSRASAGPRSSLPPRWCHPYLGSPWGRLSAWPNINKHIFLKNHFPHTPDFCSLFPNVERWKKLLIFKKLLSTSNDYIFCVFQRFCCIRGAQVQIILFVFFNTKTKQENWILQVLALGMCCKRGRLAPTSIWSWTEQSACSVWVNVSDFTKINFTQWLKTGFLRGVEHHNDISCP